MSTNAAVYAPPYYTEFRCIADKCRHSCCIDWEICIDEDTLDKYAAHPDIMATVTVCEGEPGFSLTEDGRCPHLNAQGLCDIILHHSQGLLSDICRRHPRFFHCIAPGIVEAGLGMVCEEACRRILTDTRPLCLCLTEEVDVPSELDAPAFDTRPARARILHIIESSPHLDAAADALRTAFSLPERYIDEPWLERLSSLELLDPAWEERLSAASAAPRHDVSALDGHLRRLLCYFVFRHVSTSRDEWELRARLSFALLSTEIIRKLLSADSTADLDALLDIARSFSAEIEYSVDNTDELIFACACALSYS